MQPFQFFVAEGAGFEFEHDGNAVAQGVGQSRASGHQFMGVGLVHQRAFGDWANQQFKQFFVHVSMIAVAGSTPVHPEGLRVIRNRAQPPMPAVGVATISPRLFLCKK